LQYCFVKSSPLSSGENRTDYEGRYEKKWKDMWWYLGWSHPRVVFYASFSITSKIFYGPPHCIVLTLSFFSVMVPNEHIKHMKIEQYWKAQVQCRPQNGRRGRCVRCIINFTGS
jgi:hypothetical protein